MYGKCYQKESAWIPFCWWNLFFSSKYTIEDTVLSKYMRLGKNNHLLIIFRFAR